MYATMGSDAAGRGVRGHARAAQRVGRARVRARPLGAAGRAARLVRRPRARGGPAPELSAAARALHAPGMGPCRPCSTRCAAVTPTLLWRWLSIALSYLLVWHCVHVP